MGGQGPGSPGNGVCPLVAELGPRGWGRNQDWGVNWSVISMRAFVASEWMRSPERVLGASKDSELGRDNL